MDCEHQNLEITGSALVSKHDLEVSIKCNACGKTGTVIVNIDDIEWDGDFDINEED